MRHDNPEDWIRLSLTGGFEQRLPIPFYTDLLGLWGLRDFQLAMLVKAVGYMQAGVRRILLQLPTGGGKTRMAAAMHGCASMLGLTSEFIVHRRELIDQTSRTFNELNIKHGFVAAGLPFELDNLVMLSGVQTLVNRLHLLAPPNLAIVDECHHATAASWQTVMDAYGDCIIIGLTATPERLDGKGLREHFDVMIEGPSVAELIARGFLSPFDYYAPNPPDLTGVHTVAGDFNRGEVAALMDKPKLVGDVVEHYLRLAPGEKGIFFAASREHSRNVVEAFVANGIRAAHVDGSMPAKERERIVTGYREGEFDLMSNVDLFGEGFDVPGIVYCGLGRPTKSLSLFMQQCGRALRMFEGKGNAVLADHAGNAFHHGLPDDPRQWSLEGRVTRQRGEGAENDALPVRQCKACFRISPSTVAVCPCGEEFPAQVRVLKQEEGQLTKLERAAVKAAERQQREEERERLKAEQAAQKERARIQRKIEERQCVTLQDWRELAERRNYQNPKGWARMKFQLKRGGGIR